MNKTVCLVAFALACTMQTYPGWCEQQGIAEQGKGPSTLSFVLDGGSVVYSYFDLDLNTARQMFLIHPDSASARGSSKSPLLFLIRDVYNDKANMHLTKEEAIEWVSTRARQLGEASQRHDSAFLAAVMYSAINDKCMSIGGERAVRSLKRGNWVLIFKEEKIEGTAATLGQGRGPIKNRTVTEGEGRAEMER